MRKLLYIFPFFILIQLSINNSLCANDEFLKSKTILSNPVTIDRIYKSMQGPYVEQNIDLSDSQNSELLWLRKVKLEIIDGSDYSPLSLEYLCHSHIRLDDSFFNKKNNNHFIKESMRRNALFTMIQGQNSIELPQNFAIPALSNDPLFYSMQILNLREIDKPFDVRIKTTIEYLRDADVKTEIKPLYQTAVILKIPLHESTAQMIKNSFYKGSSIKATITSKDGSIEIVPSGIGTLREQGEEVFSYHWNVPPGKHTYTFDIREREIDTRVDTTVHFATVHLHPYGESMELFDITANASVIKIDVKSRADTRGIEEVNYFSSDEGVPIYVNHKYRLITEYNNTTNQSIDAMAFMYLYLYDKIFDFARKGKE